MCCFGYHGKPVKVSSANNLKSIRAPPMPRDPCFVERSKQFLAFLKSVRLISRKHGSGILWEVLCLFNFLCFQICASSDRQKTQKPRKHALATLGRTIPKQITRRSSDSNLCDGGSQISQIGAKSGDFVSAPLKRSPVASSTGRWPWTHMSKWTFQD